MTDHNMTDFSTETMTSLNRSLLLNHLFVILPRQFLLAGSCELTCLISLCSSVVADGC